MKKLIFLLIIIAFQISYAQWEKTGWMSDEKIYNYWAKDSVIVLNKAFRGDSTTFFGGITISIDNGKSFPIISKFNDPYGIKDVLIVGKSIFICGNNYLIKSNDFGFTWESKNVGLPTNFSPNKLLSVENELFLASSVGLFHSSDFGESWQNILIGLDPTSAIENIAQYKDKLILIKNGREVYFSFDKGKNWVNRSEGLMNVQYLSKIICIADQIMVGSSWLDNENNKGIFISSDDGLTWNKYKNDSISVGTYELYPIGNQMLLYYVNKLFISTDKGTTWITKDRERPWQISVLINRITVNNDKVLASSGSELWVSSDTAETWKPIITGKNYGNVNTLAVNGDALFVGSSPTLMPTSFIDAMFYSADEGTNWIPIGIAKDKITSLCSSNNILIASGSMKNYITSDQGNTWKELPYPSDPLKYIQQFGIIGENIFVISSSQGIFKSSDNGVTWSSKSDGLPKQYSNFSAICASGSKLYLLVNRRLYISENLGENWHVYGLDIPGVGDVFRPQIAAEGNILTVKLDDYCYLSTDQGNTWNNIAKKFIFSKAYFVQALSVNNGLIFMGISQRGFFMSSDTGKKFTQMYIELPSEQVLNFANNFAFLNGYIYVGINNGYFGYYGDAIYRAKISDLLSAPEEKTAPQEFTIAPNPAGDFISIAEYAPGERIEIYSQLGVKVHETNEGAEKLDISALPAGVYFVRSGGRVGKFVKI